MAQSSEYVESELQELDSKRTSTSTLCTNNCGVTANPATNNMCQKCFNASLVSPAPGEEQSGSIKPRSAKCVNLRSSPATVVIRPKKIEALKKRHLHIVKGCSGCRKFVGLRGFRCRCGALFCSEHRYSDRHHCSYDYFSAGREAIASDYPVVLAAIMVKV
uniref:A20/AN1 zinc finger protein n=1 Tax=Lobularia maritima TaxID=226051 RepID=A0A2I6RK62_LOBMA|nr:A20/AN1 zinc finger protein [Lobularia maritima]